MDFFFVNFIVKNQGKTCFSVWIFMFRSYCEKWVSLWRKWKEILILELDLCPLCCVSFLTVFWKISMLWSVEAGQGVWLEKKWAGESGVGVGVAGSLSRPLTAQNWGWTNGKWITLLTHIISTGMYRYTFLEWNSLVYREDCNNSSYTVHNSQY